jgi:hypothetical protein
MTVREWWWTIREIRDKAHDKEIRKFVTITMHQKTYRMILTKLDRYCKWPIINHSSFSHFQ